MSDTHSSGPRTIGILCPVDRFYCRQIALSAVHRARDAGYRPLNVSAPIEPSSLFAPVVGYAAFATENLFEPLRATGVPVVNVSQALVEPVFPSVLPDNGAGGRLAVEHLLERGYRTIICSPRRGTIYSRLRGVVLRTSSDALASSDPWVASVIRYAQVNIHDGIGVTELARHFQLSRRHLSRLFREKAGCTPATMLQRVAVVWAKHLLWEDRLSLPQVAAACGYANPGHFGKMFREHTGVTPAVYRDQGQDH